ncbi:MAG: NADPH:quinone reductase [Gaiellaceae bacterium]|nr:MAG: NADPH:quinone reductase [Gaiellaceae bacterium]
MRAALVSELGSPPTVAEIEADGSIEIVAVALNPLDLAVAAGRFYGGHPPLPYVPGAEAVGRLDGARVYLFGEGCGVRRDGFLRERTDFPPELAVPVPDELDDATAAASGIAGVAAWVPLARLAPVRRDDRVLVLGASGLVGKIAVQVARLLGAERVVAAGRSAEKLAPLTELGADAQVVLDGEGVVERMRDACGGDGPTVVLDPLWGAPVEAAIEAAAPKARVVNLGQSAGPVATVASAAVRGKQLTILGHANVSLPPDERRAAYEEVAAHVAAGRIRIERETFTLEQVANAWQAQAAGRKAVVLL